MATAMDDNGSRENGLNNNTTTSMKSDNDDILDYNEAFPQLKSSTSVGGSRTNLFPSRPGLMANSVGSSHPNNRNEDERRRQMAMQSSTVTKIIEIPPDERIGDKTDNNRRGPNQSSRSTGANSNGQNLQKICGRIQKETSTSITFLYRDQTLIVTITGKQEGVRLAQVQLLREIQKPVQLPVQIPLDFHRYIIGTRGATLRQLEQETFTNIKVPQQDSQSDAIVISGARDNVKLCEQKILNLYHTQMNKGFERLMIPQLYHPWIRHHLMDELQSKFKVTINIPPPTKPIDEIAIRGDREPVDQTKAAIMNYLRTIEGKIMSFPLEIPCEQHRFVLGKKGAGIKEIFDKTNVVVRIPNQDENLSTIQVIGETANIGEAITMIYKMANALTVQIPAARWIQSKVRGEHNSRLETYRTAHPDVRINFRDDHIALEGPPEEVENVRSQIQSQIDELHKNNIICIEVDVDPQYYKQLIGKSQSRLQLMQEQTGCEIKFPPFEEGRTVQIMGKKENAEKARQMLQERTQKFSNETSVTLNIDPQHYAQIIGTKGKSLADLRSKFQNVQINFPEANSSSTEVVIHGDREGVKQCEKLFLEKYTDLHRVEIEIPRRLCPMLIGKNGANIHRLREKAPDVNIDVPSLDDTKEVTSLRISGKKQNVNKAKELLDKHIQELTTSVENTIEQYMTIDPKWHGRFFQNQRRLLKDLQQQFGEMLIKLPERGKESDQVLLRGPKESVEQVRKRLEELIDTWENTTTKEMSIPHRHHGYLLAHGGAHIQPIQKEYNVQIKFPPRANPTKEENEENHDETQQDTVRITGRAEDVTRAMTALENVIPVETTVDIPSECHGSLVGKGGSHLHALNKQYPDVQITLPRMNSAQNTIQLRGNREQVESVRKELLDSYEKYQADRQARSFEVRFTIKPEDRSIIFGTRGRTINNLRQKYDVKIELISNQTPSTAIVPTPSADENRQAPNQPDDQQAAPEDNLVLPSETDQSNTATDVEVVITGYEEKAFACRDEILQLIKEFESRITMEIEIDPRVHARIIGSGGQKLQQIMKDFDVDIKFQTNTNSNKVHVIGLDQEKIDSCIDHLVLLEEDFLQDLPYRPSNTSQNTNEYSLGQSISNVQQQEVPSTNTNKNNRNDGQFSKNKQTRQAPFQVKNAPWANGNENENDNHQQGKYSRQRNGHENSPKKSTPAAPNRDDLGEYPSFSNGVGGTREEMTSQVQQTTVNTLPVIWGPQKRNN